jgi:MSHA biogenesis protein MshO
MTRHNPAARGFSLIEAIIAIVITGIVAGMISVFMVLPITAYFDSTRRAGMTDAADSALRRMAYDIRLAVPNSVRVVSAPVAIANRFVEFIPTRDGGRYRAQRDAAGCAVASPADPIYDADDCTVADNHRFDVLGPDVVGNNGDFIVIYNTGQNGLDAYQSGQNRRAVTAGGSKVSFTPTATPYPPFESPSQRFQIVPADGPVSYGCISVATPAGFGGFELRRFTAYHAGTDDWSTQPTAVAGSSALLASDLSECHFDYQALSAANGLLVLRLSMQRENETLSLVHQIHVDNTP